MMAALLISQLSVQACFNRDWAAVEHNHRDMNGGRVAWIWSWNEEGVADDWIVFDCANGDGLRARARSERMQSDLPFDRRARAARVIDNQERGHAFFSMAGFADAMAAVNVPTTPYETTETPCACSVFYPDLPASEQAQERPADGQEKE